MNIPTDSCFGVRKTCCLSALKLLSFFFVNPLPIPSPHRGGGSIFLFHVVILEVREGICFNPGRCIFLFVYDFCMTISLFRMSDKIFCTIFVF